MLAGGPGRGVEVGRRSRVRLDLHFGSLLPDPPWRRVGGVLRTGGHAHGPGPRDDPGADRLPRVGGRVSLAGRGCQGGGHDRCLEQRPGGIRSRTGAMEAEYTAFGYDFPSARTRLDQLEEACVVVPGRLLLAGSANVLTVPTISESPASCRGVRTGASTSRPGSARANPRNAVDTWRCRAGMAPSFPASKAWIASGRLAGPAR